MVCLFIAAGMDINEGALLSGTALMVAAKESHVEVVRLLLEHGADINAQDEYGLTNGMTALMVAARGPC